MIRLNTSPHLLGQAANDASPPHPAPLACGTIGPADRTASRRVPRQLAVAESLACTLAVMTETLGNLRLIDDQLATAMEAAGLEPHLHTEMQSVRAATGQAIGALATMGIIVLGLIEESYPRCEGKLARDGA